MPSPEACTRPVTTIVTPELFGTQLSVLILLMVIFGGAGTRFGPVIGATVIGLLPILFGEDPTFSVYLYGTILIVSMRRLPRGLFRRTAAPVAGARFLRRIRRDPASSRSGLGLRSFPRSPVAASWLCPLPAGVNSQSLGVSRSFGGVKAVSHADLHIRRGEVVAIIGSNGSGKTTLLNLVCGYYRPADRFNPTSAGRDITSARPKAIARTGSQSYVPGAQGIPEPVDRGTSGSGPGPGATRSDPVFERHRLGFPGARPDYCVNQKL